MTNETIVALTSILLVITSVAQIVILVIQNRQSRLHLIAEYRERWRNAHKNWAEIVFIGRDANEYYQVVDQVTLNELILLREQSSLSAPTIWARDSTQTICGLLNEVCLRILQGQLYVSDAYPIFGTEFLRHSRPLRNLFDKESSKRTFYGSENDKHLEIQNEVRNWLIYHDGIRRRCLILIDLLWAEATRLEDLPPDDIRSAADAKKNTGNLNRLRVFNETYRLNGIFKLFLACKLYYFLFYAEYRSGINRIGIKKGRLEKLDYNWTDRLLSNN